MNHWQGMKDFCEFDRAAGGPDSHMTTIAHLSRHLTLEERAWWGGVYVAVYNVPQALAILDIFPTRHNTGIRTWITEHWPHIVLRRERRRPVGSPIKLAECLESIAKWINVDSLGAMTSYDEVWAATDKIKYFGRYAKLKISEVLRRQGVVQPIIPDLRAKDGWSPREGLALLFPEHAALLNDGGNTPDVLQEVERLASLAQQTLNSDLDTYQLQVFACDYKQCVNGRQYPGRSLDSELTHHANVAKHFPLDNRMFMARGELFPAWALGEGRWMGVREELGEVFSKHDYMWSDKVYDYEKTKNLAEPVRR